MTLNYDFTAASSYTLHVWIIKSASQSETTSSSFLCLVQRFSHDHAYMSSQTFNEHLIHIHIMTAIKTNGSKHSCVGLMLAWVAYSLHLFVCLLARWPHVYVLPALMHTCFIFNVRWRAATGCADGERLLRSSARKLIREEQPFLLKQQQQQDQQRRNDSRSKRCRRREKQKKANAEASRLEDRPRPAASRTCISAAKPFTGIKTEVRRWKTARRSSKRTRSFEGVARSFKEQRTRLPTGRELISA